MQSWFIICSLLTSFMVLGAEAHPLAGVSKSVFEILPGKLHKGGTLVATPTQTETPGIIRISIDYQIIKKNLVPVPNAYLSGNYEQLLPEEFLNETGYLNLEQAAAIETQGATLVHLGRVPYRDHQDAHSIQIIPDNGKSEIHLVYHPSIPGLGWDEVKLILHTPIPLLGHYWIEGKLRTPAPINLMSP